MPVNIVWTPLFKRDFRSLPSNLQQRARKPIGLPLDNPSHLSLRTKKMQGVKDIWEASVTLSYRLTYQRTAGTIVLRRVGTHDVLYEERR